MCRGLLGNRACCLHQAFVGVDQAFRQAPCPADFDSRNHNTSCGACERLDEWRLDTTQLYKLRRAKAAGNGRQVRQLAAAPPPSRSHSERAATNQHCNGSCCCPPLRASSLESCQAAKSACSCSSPAVAALALRRDRCGRPASMPCSCAQHTAADEGLSGRCKRNARQRAKSCSSRPAAAHSPHLALHRSQHLR